MLNIGLPNWFPAWPVRCHLHPTTPRNLDEVVGPPGRWQMAGGRLTLRFPIRGLHSSSWIEYTLLWTPYKLDIILTNTSMYKFRIIVYFFLLFYLFIFAVTPFKACDCNVAFILWIMLFCILLVLSYDNWCNCCMSLESLFIFLTDFKKRRRFSIQLYIYIFYIYIWYLIYVFIDRFEKKLWHSKELSSWLVP